MTADPVILLVAALVMLAFAAAAMLRLGASLRRLRREQEDAELRVQQLLAALEGAQMGIWDYRVPEETIELSAAARRIFGFEAEGEAPPLAEFLKLIHSGDRRRVAGALRRASQGGVPFELEFRLARNETGNRWVVAKGKRLSAARVVGLCSDITQRKVEEALNAGQQRILEMITGGASLQSVLDESVRLVESEAPGMLCSVLLLDPDGIHARHASAPTMPADYVKAIDGLVIGPNRGSCGTAMYLRRPVYTVDTQVDPRWAEYRELTARHGLRACWSSPILNEQKKVLGSFAGYFREPRSPNPTELRLIELTTGFCAIVLERKRLEAETHEQQRAVAHLGRVVMLGELSGALAHEINQPLAAILSDAQAAQRLLQRERPDIEELGEILSDIVEADHRAANVIDRLHLLLRKDQLEPTPIELGEVVTATLSIARRDLVARGVVVSAQLDPWLPLVLGDRVQLEQVVLNLAFNAADAMQAAPAGARRLAVRTSLQNGMAQLSFADSGPGIPAGMEERIFEPFFTQKERGLGLGLAICRSIVSNHQGRLWAENNPTGGAIFHLAIPVLAEVTPAASRPSRSLPPAIR